MFFARQASTRLVCALFSLPVPPENPSGPKEDSTTFSRRSVPEYLEKERVHKLLLFGLEGSGTSTIFKQVASLSFFLSFFFQSLGLLKINIHYKIFPKMWLVYAYAFSGLLDVVFLPNRHCTGLREYDVFSESISPL